MAGALTIDTLHSTVEPYATGNAFSGIAKAWVNFNGVTGSIYGSFNVSSVTVSGPGVYIVNFSNLLASSNYSAFANAAPAGAGPTYCTVYDTGAYTPTAPSQSSYGIGTLTQTGSYKTSLYVTSAVFA